MTTVVLRVPVVLGLLLSLSSPVASNGQPGCGGPPLYYERYDEGTPHVGDELSLLRSDSVRVPQFQPVGVATFAWEHNSFIDYTWLSQMQALRFLLPAMRSTAEEDRNLARAWFMRWYSEFMVPAPAVAQWGEPSTVGYRAMVLALLLKEEQQRAEPDTSVAGFMRASLRAHQADLARPERFDETSNHGLIAELGLFETTRVMPNRKLSSLAVARIESLASRIVSRQGVEIEHSPGYHFEIMAWLEEMSEYLGSVPGVDAVAVARMRDIVSRMQRASCFLEDHNGMPPAIGDTDSVPTALLAPAVSLPQQAGETLFDPEAGYAIYKGLKERGDFRYVIFRIPGSTIEFNRHVHSDALSVFFSSAGETILGDSGRYSYETSVTRNFMLSAQAHNTIVPYPLDSPAGVLRRCRDACERSGGHSPGWSASMDIGRTIWTRTVTVEESSGRVLVVDALKPLNATDTVPDEIVLLWNTGYDVVSVDSGRGGTNRRTWDLSTRHAQRIQLTVNTVGGGAAIVGVGIARGQREPMLGWYSPGREMLRPVSTIWLHLRRKGTVTVTTEVAVKSSAGR